MTRWHQGDVAYCANAIFARGILEQGRTYTVAKVLDVPNYHGCGLALAETRPPAPLEYFSSNRFVRLVPGQSALRQIEAARTPADRVSAV